MRYLHPLIDRIAAAVTTYPRTVLLVMLLLTMGTLAGIPQIQAQQQGAFGDEVDLQSDIARANEYIENQYAALGSDDDEPTATSYVYVRVDDGNALTRSSILDALAYQQSVKGSDAVASQLVDDGMTGPPNVIAQRLAADPTADLAAQRQAVEAASEAEIQRAITQTFTGDELTQTYLPATYDPATGEAESFRMAFEFAIDDPPENQIASPPSDAQRVLYETAEEDATIFTVGEHAQQPWLDQQLLDSIWLIVVPALALIVCVLAFAYRDIVDVGIGFVGVLVSVLWMFGFLGWLGVPAGLTIVIGPVLIIALSIDFGLHVFMRYREARGPNEDVTTAMRASTAAVGIAFLLVTVTAAVGFLSNLSNPISLIRQLGIGITLGVLSAFVIFVTLVPALKILVDRNLERFGLDRRKAALGSGDLAGTALTGGVRLAVRAAPFVVAIALVGGVVGGLAFADLDRQGVQNTVEVEEWKTELPGPFAWEAADMAFRQNQDYVEAQYQGQVPMMRVTRFLVEGDVGRATALERIEAGHAAADESDVTFRQGGSVRVESPLVVMDRVAARDPGFAEVYREADTSGDGVPDENIEGVYDALFDAAPEEAARVIERDDDGQYRSLLVHVPVQQGLDMGVQGDAMHDIAATMAGDTGLTVTPVGVATINNAEMGILAEGILETMAIALLSILVVVTVVYRIERESAMLGVVTVIPIALVVGLVIGSMRVFDIPLTMLTALLMSIAIGLGVDYNIHVSDRFVQELSPDTDPETALDTAVTGTGGALLGSALTSCAAFAMLLLHPSAQVSAFGAIIVLALTLSFLMSVVVLPSMLYLWANKWRARPQLDRSVLGTGND